MNEPTPGPWEVVGTAGCIFIESEEWEIAQITHDGEEADSQTMADAILIANAPTMLDTIVDALNDFEEYGLHAKECDCVYCNGIARLREAYKKATGQ